MISMKYSSQKLTQFLQRKNVIDAEASNINSFLWRDACVQLNQIGLFATKKVYLLLEKPKLQEVFLSKN
jgi:hypothetical protein